MNRGSPKGWETNVKSKCRFNEAPIHESGKSTASAKGAESGTGFNEAPIHESGKWLRASPR